MRIMVSGLHYPISIFKFFKNGFTRLGHEVWSVGPFLRTLPWRRDKDYTDYLDVPDFETPNAPSFPIHLALAMCPWEPDLIVMVDAGFHLAPHNTSGIPTALVLTDPHALNYLPQTNYADCIFGMQQYYNETIYNKACGGRIWYLPYAFDPEKHFWCGKDFSERKYEVCLISGLLYEDRLKDLVALNQAGINVFQDSGILYEAGSVAYNQAVISLNHSSQLDLPARFFEGMAYRNLVFTNPVPDLMMLQEFVPDKHYVVFNDRAELVSKALYYRAHPDEAWEIASRGYAAVWEYKHTYTQRCGRIIDACNWKAKGGKK